MDARGSQKIRGISAYADGIYAPEANLEPGLALLARYGIGWTDLRAIAGGNSLLRLTDRELDAVAGVLEKYGIKVGALATPVFRCPLRGNNAINWGGAWGFPADMGFEEHLGLLSRAFEIADRFGSKNVRCFAFWREYEADQTFDELVGRLEIAANRAEAWGRTLLVQNDQDTMAGTGVELARLIEAVGSPFLKASYDVSNAARLAVAACPDDYRALRGVIGHVQLKPQVIDIRCGWGLPDPDESGPRSPHFPSYFWQQPDLPISGWVQIGDRRFELEGPRTFLRADETVGIDYRSLFIDLKNDGYNGFITVDSNCFIAGAGANAEREVEANFGKAVEGLRSLIGEVWP